MSINRVCITGNLTRDPEIRATTNGTQVMNFGMAVNDRRRNQQTGEWEDRPNFVDCVLFGQRVNSISRYLHKGNKVAIEGKLRQNTWESDGQKRSRIEVVVDDIEFMTRSGDGKQSQPQGATNAQAYQQPAPMPSYQQQYQQVPQQAPQQTQMPNMPAPQYAPQDGPY